MVAQEVGATAVVGFRVEHALAMNRMVFGLHVSVNASGTALLTRPKHGRYQSSIRWVTSHDEPRERMCAAVELYPADAVLFVPCRVAR